MNVVCPNSSCNAQYDIDPARIPTGKKGFKCAQCGGFIPVNIDAAHVISDSHVTESAGTPKSLVIILMVALLMIAGGAGFFYYQLQIINQGGLLVEGQPVNISNERMIELKDRLRQIQQQTASTKEGETEKTLSEDPAPGKI